MRVEAPEIALSEYLLALEQPAVLDRLLRIHPPLLVVDLDDGPSEPGDAEVTTARRCGFVASPLVVVGCGKGASARHPWADVCDVVVDRSHDETATIDRIAETVQLLPIASVTGALLLRSHERLDLWAGLVAESAAYSTLQGGTEFSAWRASRHERREPRARTGDDPTVRVDLEDGRLLIRLERPEVHNALSRQMRDELYDAVMIAVADPSLEVVVEGAGPSFCSGGDLDEFGTTPNPALAHVVRLQRSVGRLMAGIADRTTVRLHGAAFGAGIELAAFASRVEAAPGTRIALPEVRLGLVPGAGGTVSLPRRIGRHLTAELMLTATPIDAGTAFCWGLVDVVR